MCGNPLNSKRKRKSTIENTYGIIIGPENKENRKNVFDYINKHHGCKLKDITKNFEKDMGEKKVRKIVRILEKLGQIENKPKNGRDYVYYVKKENEFFMTNEKINTFYTKYRKLLKKCENNHELKNIKDKINQEKIGSLHHEQKREEFEFIISEYHRSERIFNRIHYFITKINQSFNEINNLEENLLQLRNQELKKHSGLLMHESEKIKPDKVTLETIQSYHDKKKQFVETMKHSIKIINQLLPDYKERSKNCGLLRINYWNVYTFILFTHYINFYNVMRWPNIIMDSTMRNNLNALLYEKVLDINKMLNDYQSSNELVSKEIYYLIKGEHYRSFMNINDYKYYQMMIDYEIFDLDKQIKDILKSIITVDEYENKNILSLEEYLEKNTDYCNEYFKNF